MLNWGSNTNYFDERLNDEGRKARLHELMYRVDYTAKVDRERTAIGLRETPVGKTNPGVSGGWEGRSDDSAFKRYIIFEVGGIAEAAAFRAWALGCNTLDGKFKSLQGSWKGRHQPSFICEDTNAHRAALAPWVAGQEALLCLGPAYRKGPDGLPRLFGNREAILDWLQPDGYQVKERERMPGLWQAVSKATALKLDDWTFDPLELQYYAVV